MCQECLQKGERTGARENLHLVTISPCVSFRGLILLVYLAFCQLARLEMAQLSTAMIRLGDDVRERVRHQLHDLQLL